MHIIVLAPRPQTVETLLYNVLGRVMDCRGGVPADAWHTLESTAGSGGAEAPEGTGDEAEASSVWGFDGAGEEGLQADADTEEGLASGDVCLDCGEEAGCGEAGQAMAEMADARKDEFLDG
jgi:hypothetical protein